jgi:hypothetical protein
MIDGYVIRVLVALLFAAFMWAQARAARGRPHRKRAFELLTGALLAFAGFNSMLAADVVIGPLQITVAVIGLALFVGAIVSLVLSFGAGELRDQRDRIAAAAREYRERREERDRHRS